MNLIYQYCYIIWCTNFHYLLLMYFHYLLHSVLDCLLPWNIYKINVTNALHLWCFRFLKDKNTFPSIRYNMIVLIIFNWSSLWYQIILLISSWWSETSGSWWNFAAKLLTLPLNHSTFLSFFSLVAFQLEGEVEPPTRQPPRNWSCGSLFNKKMEGRVVVSEGCVLSLIGKKEGLKNCATSFE